MFLRYHEKGWIRDKSYGSLLYYKSYVDYIFVVFEIKDYTDSFYNYVNRQHSNIKFTMQTQKDGKLPRFLSLQQA